MWLGSRLPTEVEWYAEASNNSDRDYPWGDTPAASCDYGIVYDSRGEGCGKFSTSPVCSKPMGHSVSGLCDMVGNVWEWTSTLTSAIHRVKRGGSWKDADQASLRSSARRPYENPQDKSHHTGIRCVSNTAPQP